MHSELNGQLARRWNPVARTQVAAMHQSAQLVAKLDVQRYVALGLKLERKHWLSLLGQSTPLLWLVKSQFVYGQHFGTCACRPGFCSLPRFVGAGLLSAHRVARDSFAFQFACNMPLVVCRREFVTTDATGGAEYFHRIG
jgi:hypothetical protein